MNQHDERPLAGPDDESEIVVPQQDEVRVYLNADDALVIERRSVAASPKSPWGSEKIVVIQRPYLAAFVSRLGALVGSLAEG